MKDRTVCRKIDDWTLVFTRYDISIVVTIDDGIMCVINPAVDVNGCPLILYGKVTDVNTFMAGVLGIIRGSFDMYFTTSTNMHMQYVSFVEGNEAILNLIIKVAQRTKSKFEEFRNSDSSIEPFERAVSIM